MKLFKQLKFILLFIIILIILAGVRMYRGNYFKRSAEQAFQVSLETGYDISRSELSNLDNKYTLVDLRNKELFTKSHLENAIHIEFKDLLNKSNQKILKKSGVIVFYSSRITESVKAKSLLSQMGYATIYILDISANADLNKEVGANSQYLRNEVFKYKFLPDSIIRQKF